MKTLVITAALVHIFLDICFSFPFIEIKFGDPQMALEHITTTILQMKSVIKPTDWFA